MKIDRHTIDAEYMKDMTARFERTFGGLPAYLSGAKRDAKNLVLLAGEAASSLGYGCVTNAESSKLGISLRTAADAYRALFVVAAARSTPVVVQFGDGSKLNFNNRPDESTVHVGRWLTGFYLNVLCLDGEATKELSEIPPALLEKSTTTGPDYLKTYMQSLQIFGSQKVDGLVDLAIAALQQTDPKRADISDPDWALNLHVPQIEVFIRLATGDAKFGESLVKAVELHKKYWSKTKDRRRDYNGYISVPLTALAVVGAQRGLPIEVESPYLPMFLARA
jgi:hypothetical protein